MDEEGRAWDVVVGRESWGALYAIFVLRGDDEVRQAILKAESTDQAQREIEELDRADLLALLERSEPKSLNG